MQRYVAGNSLGGYGAWHLVCARPELFATAIPISGGGNPALAQNMVDVSVWAIHGAKDRNVPAGGSRDIIEAIKEAVAPGTQSIRIKRMPSGMR